MQINRQNRTDSKGLISRGHNFVAGKTFPHSKGEVEGAQPKGWTT